jgi:Uncharacterised nucleotidyltransferase
MEMNENANAKLADLSSSSKQWLLSLLRGDATPFPDGLPGGEMNRFLRFTDDAGIQPYLCYRLKQTGTWQTCPPRLAQAIEGRYLMERISARLRRDELTRVLAEFDRHGIRALVLKGSALVHLIYPEPNLRPACDIDLFVDPAARPRAEQTIRSLGYCLAKTHNFEAQYFRLDGNVEHLLDLHWKLSDSPFLGPLFAFDELFDRSIPINGLSVAARGLDLIDALLNACVHLAAHRDWDHLVWLLDIDLLSRRLTDAEFEAFVDRAITRQCATICLEALKRTQEIFGAGRDHPAIRRLANRPETSAYLLNPERDSYHEFHQLLRVSPWSQRVRLLRLALFPPLDVISPEHTRAGGSVVYLRRLINMPARCFSYFRRKIRE